MKSLNTPLLLTACAFFACTNSNTIGNDKLQDKNTSTVRIETCPCDSSTAFYENRKEVTQCFVGKSMIETSRFQGSDTMDVRRYYDAGKGWLLQEAIEVKNNQLVNSGDAMICDIIDTAGFYNLVYYSNEDMYIKQGVVTNSVLGVEVIVDKDTIRSNGIGLLVPKDKFKGIVTFGKKTNITYKGKREDRLGLMFIEAENLTKYGNLLEQYKAISKCSKNWATN